MKENVMIDELLDDEIERCGNILINQDATQDEIAKARERIVMCQHRIATSSTN